ncbi:MAG: outer membrane lipoprotein LolB [Burkholderiaceae bacterium]|nr:outer membrane lipoprotein LolB [Burkholderiaceae bacterium]
MLLRVSSDPPQTVNAGFELKGSPMAGLLVLTGPLGNIAATLQWNAEGATLHRAGEAGQTFASLDALAQQATGTPFPIAALFDWLAGRDTQVAGWLADLSQLDQGRLSASRSDPEPSAQLQIVLESSVKP